MTKTNANQNVPSNEPKQRTRRTIKAAREMITVKNAQPGDKWQGKYVGTIDGNYGSMMVFNRLDEDLPGAKEKQFIFPIYGALEDVEFLPQHNYEIVYNGEKQTKKGQNFHDFEVFELDAESFDVEPY